MSDGGRRSGVFINYRRDDTAAYVEALAQKLNTRFGSDRVFRDTDNIRPGDNFVHEIERRLKSCSVLIAVIGRAWLTATDSKTGARRLDNPNDYLRLELATALRNRNLTVIPVLVDNAVMPEAGQLPQDLYELSLRQALDVQVGARFNGDAERLLRAIERVDPGLAKGRVKTRSIGPGKLPRKAAAVSDTRADPQQQPSPSQPAPQQPALLRQSAPAPVAFDPGAAWKQDSAAPWQAYLSLESRVGITLLFAAVFAANWLETSLETLVKDQFTLGERLGYNFATAMAWLEGGLSFERHDLSSGLAVYGSSTAYFFVYPLLLLATMIALTLRRDVAAYRAFAVAIGTAYVASLGCFIMMPVPERWAFPDSQAVLLSDLWSASLIRAVRPISGLDNCFPSFHVSSSVVVMLTWYVYRLPFRLSVALLGFAVILSTFLLGIHWLPDIGAGAALGAVSVRIALRLNARRAPALTSVVAISPAGLVHAGVGA